MKKSREELRKERDFIAGILETSGTLLMVLDAKGRVVRFNRGCERVTGYAADEVLGQNLWECLQPPEQSPAVKAMFDDLLIDALSDRPARFVVAKDGGRRLIQWSDTVLRDARARWTSLAFTGLDITEQRQAEESRTRSLRRLERVNRLQEELLLPATLDEKFKKITDAAMDLLDLDFCRIWKLRPGDLCDSGCIHAAATGQGRQCPRRDKCLHLVASSGRYTHIDGGHRRVPLGAYKIGRIAADTEKKFLTNSVTTDPHVADHQWAQGPWPGLLRRLPPARRPRQYDRRAGDVRQMSPFPRRTTPSSPTWRTRPPR